MATIQIMLNNVVKAVNEKTASVLSAILTTDNPGADTVKKAVEMAGGSAYVSLFSAGDENDTFVCVKEISRKGVKGTVTGSATRSQIAKRMLLALDAENWQSKIVTVMSETTAKNSNTEEMEVI